MKRSSSASALDLPMADSLPDSVQKYLDICQEKLGLVPNVLRAYAFDESKFKAFVAFYNDLMLGNSGLTKLEREMIAVVVSSENRCLYCIVAHGAAVRLLSEDQVLADTLCVNYRLAEITPRQRAMLDFAVKATRASYEVEENDRMALRTEGFNDHDIWDISAVCSFFNMTNRMATITDMRPNPEYHTQGRDRD